jgi:hypothetical protein
MLAASPAYVSALLMAALGADGVHGENRRSHEEEANERGAF